jgi:hypothetical protein
MIIISTFLHSGQKRVENDPIHTESGVSKDS